MLIFFTQLSKMLLASVDLGCSEEVCPKTSHVVAGMFVLGHSHQVLTVVAMLSGDGGKVILKASNANLT
jgi:hypothetical protein